MNTFDLFIIIPIALGFTFGLFKGFVKEVVSLLAVILALLAAEFFSGRLSPAVSDWFNLSGKAATTLSYVLIFIITVVGAFVLSRITDRVLRSISLGWLNSILGAVFGALKIAVVVSVLMNVFDALDSKFNFASPEKKEASLSYYPILKLAPSLWDEAKKGHDSSKSPKQVETVDV